MEQQQRTGADAAVACSCQIRGYVPACRARVEAPDFEDSGTFVAGEIRRRIGSVDWPKVQNT